MPADLVRTSVAALLQGDLPLTARPFAEVAKAAGRRRRRSWRNSGK